MLLAVSVLCYCIDYGGDGNNNSNTHDDNTIDNNGNKTQHVLGNHCTMKNTNWKFGKGIPRDTSHCCRSANHLY